MSLDLDLTSKADWIIEALDLAIPADQLAPVVLHTAPRDQEGAPSKPGAANKEKEIQEAIAKEKAQRAEALKATSDKLETALLASQKHLEEGAKYLAPEEGGALQQQWSELETAATEQKKEAGAKALPPRPAEDFVQACTALAATEGKATKLIAVMDDAKAAAEQVRTERLAALKEEMATAKQASLEAIAYEQQVKLTSPAARKRGTLQGDLRKKLEAHEASEKLQATAAHADFNIAFQAAEKDIAELRTAAKASENAAAEIELNTAKKDGPLKKVDTLKVPLRKMASRNAVYEQGLAAVAAANKDGGPAKALAEYRALTQKMEGAGEFLEKFTTFYNKEVLPLQKSSAKGQADVLAGLEKEAYTKADTNFDEGLKVQEQLRVACTAITKHNKTLEAYLKSAPYTTALAQADTTQKKELQAALDAVKNTAGDDATLTKAQANLTVLEETANRIGQEVTAFYELTVRPLERTNGLSNTFGFLAGLLDREIKKIKDDAKSVGYTASTIALQASAKRIEEVLAFDQQYSRRRQEAGQDSALLTKIEAARKQLDNDKGVAAKATNMLNQVGRGIDYTKEAKSIDAEYQTTLASLRPDQQKTLSDAFAKAQQDRDPEQMREVGKQMKFAAEFTKDLSHIEGIIAKAGPGGAATAAQDHLSQALEAAKVLDYETAQREMAEAQSPEVHKAAYDKLFAAGAAPHAAALLSAQAVQLKAATTLGPRREEARQMGMESRYKEGMALLVELEKEYARIALEKEQIRYEEVLADFDADYLPAQAAAHADLQVKFTSLKGQATNLYQAGNVARINQAITKFVQITPRLAGALSMARASETAITKYSEVENKCVPADLVAPTQTLTQAKALVLTNNPQAEQKFKEVATAVDTTVKPNAVAFTKPISGVTSKISGARVTVSALTDGTDVSTLVANGRMTAATVATLVPKTVGNTWHSNRMPGGFQYEGFSDGTYTYHVHGHGPDNHVAAGGNSNSGGNIVRVRREENNNVEWLKSDGTWDDDGHFSEDTHIPLV